MSTKNFLTVTILVSIFALSPISAKQINATNPISLNQINTINSKIASILHKRGLDEDVSYDLVKDLSSNNDNLEEMLTNFLEIYQDINREEALDFLATSALYRKNIKLNSYDNLVHMASKIENKKLSSKDLDKITTITKINSNIV